MAAKAGATVAIVCITGLLCFCGHDEDEKPPAQPTSTSRVRLSPAAVAEAGIQTAVVERSLLEPVLSLTGTLAAKPWTSEEQAAVDDAAAADSKRSLAEANFRRVSRLYAQGITARQDLDAARAEKDQAEAAASQADAKRANLGLSAASRGLEATSRIWGLASLADVDLAKVRAGEPVDVTTAAFPGAAFRGRVVEVSKSEDPDTREFTVRIAIDDPQGRLHPQMLAGFAISTPGGTPAITVPKSALLLEGGGAFAYVVSGGAFEKRRVVTGAATRDRTEIVSGLRAGERVVTAGAQILESERLKSQLQPADED